MKNVEEYLLSLVEYGKNILDEYKDAHDDFRLPTALMALLHLEEVLDKGRILLNDANPETVSQINTGMDEIRTGILGLMGRIGKSEVKALLESAAQNFRLNFTSHLQE